MRDQVGELVKVLVTVVAEVDLGALRHALVTGVVALDGGGQQLLARPAVGRLALGPGKQELLPLFRV
jgi:hypothetical protein